MKELNKQTVQKPELPVKILQFGEGNFLRAFVDWMIDIANEKGIMNHGVVVVQPIDKGLVEMLNKQDDLYHVYLEGIKDKKPTKEIRLVKCIQDAVNPYSDYEKYENYYLLPELEILISNTTEAGIRYEEGEDIFAKPPKSFPGKVTALLYNRFKHFNGAADKGLTIICCELIENNGSTLYEYVMKHAKANNLGEDFIAWVENNCPFCDTLVDRIVPGFPRENIDEIKKEIGYNDNLVVKGEFYHLWAIGGKDYKKVQEVFPLDKAGLHVIYMPSIKAFRDKKVRVLNGSHTGMVPVALQMGSETVKDAFNNPLVEKFINSMVAEEVLPMIDEDKAELEAFAEGILERFYNPYIKHMLATISLNSLSKWEARNYPTVLDNYVKAGKTAKYNLFTFAALMVLYSGKSQIDFTPDDTPEQVTFIQENWDSNDIEKTIIAIVTNRNIWKEDFTQIKTFIPTVTAYVKDILDNGMDQAIQDVLNS
ncbi:MAG: tagaturonate reductase [Odoribacter sp.]|nr:tagaturonate reductase [Odoribacter sp.]